MIHTGCKPFYCPICNFFFSQSGVLKITLGSTYNQILSLSFKQKYIYFKSKLQETYKIDTHNCNNTSARNVTKLSGHVGTSNSIFVRFTQEMNPLTAFDLLAMSSSFLSLVFWSKHYILYVSSQITHFTALHCTALYLNPWRTSIDKFKPLTQLKATFVIKIMKLFDTYL